jgi:sugar phosphate isomerase/epimerase
MARPVTLFTGQWADLDFEVVCRKAKTMGYDGLELACWGNHLELDKATEAYCESRLETLAYYGLRLYAISNHLIGQCVCDRIDERHQSIVPAHVWGHGDPEGVRQRAAQEMIRCAQVAHRLGVKTVNGFSGSSIWHLAYAFPAVPESMIDRGYMDFADRWKPILDEFQKLDLRFALEVHPTGIAFDIPSAEQALQAVGFHPAFGFNFDPSHLAYQGVDYIEFIHRFCDRIFHVQMKDVKWSANPTPAGVFGGHLPFGDHRRYWDFRSIGHGNIEFEEIIRALNYIGYHGPLSVEWEDSGMDRERGAAESCAYVKGVDFSPQNSAFESTLNDRLAEQQGYLR